MIDVEIKGYKEVQSALSQLGDFITASDLLLPAAFDQLARIKLRTAQGLDSNKDIFEPYADSYSKHRLSEGHSAQKVDLFFSGRMQAAMSAEVLDESSVRLFFNDPAQGLKAFYHHSGAGNLPVRDFFSINADDVIELEKAVDLAIEKKIEELGLK